MCKMMCDRIIYIERQILTRMGALAAGRPGYKAMQVLRETLH